jgi:hypothetical protein
MGTNGHVDVKIGPNGLKIYSSTAVLSPYFKEAMEKSKVRQEVIDHASGKGTLVHSHAYRYAQDERQAYETALGVPDETFPESFKAFEEARHFCETFEANRQNILGGEQKHHEI